MIKTIFTPLLEFLFPTSDTIQSLEETRAEDLLKLLPHAQDNADFYCLFAYQDEKVKELVWEIKYYKNTKVADQVGKLIAQKILEKTDDSKQHVLVPIPQTARRLNERGFNHTELITTSVLKYLPSRFSYGNEILKKIRHTPRQNSIEDREDRFRNIQGAFAATDPNKVAERNAIIIDDVITTGATTGEARRVLTEAQAKEVTVFAIAH